LSAEGDAERPDAADPRDRIRRTVAALDAAFDAGDLAAVLSFYEPQALLVAAPGPDAPLARGHAEMAPLFRAWMAACGGVRVIDSVELVADDIALVVARWTIRRGADAAPAEDVATSVLRRGGDGCWRLVVDNAFGPRLLAA
jgi:uncharacterized protein (TIGR02246 family)